MDGQEDISYSLKQLIKRAKTSHADVRIGKRGVNDEIINEINRRLKDHKVIKVKIGIDVDDRESFAKEIAAITRAKLIEVRGFTFILAKEDDSS